MSSAEIDRDYNDNGHVIDSLEQEIETHGGNLERIVVRAGSSPDGSRALNEKVARQRAQNVKKLLEERFPWLAGGVIETVAVGEDWSGMRRTVEAATDIPAREKALEVLNMNTAPDLKMLRFRGIGHTATFRYMNAHIFPELRVARVELVYYDEVPVVVPIVAPVVVQAAPPVEEEVLAESVAENVVDNKVIGNNGEVETVTPTAVKKAKKVREVRYPKPYFALKTNLLFDAATLVNLSIEIPMGRRVSLAGNFMFPQWTDSRRRFAVQSLNGDLELRIWYGSRAKMDAKPRLTGWFTGIYGGAGNYLLEWKREGVEGNFWHAGITVGYAHAINKRGNLRMEYLVGGGWFSAEYDRYRVQQDVRNEATTSLGKGKYAMFLPTKAAISLVWMVGTRGLRTK